MADCNKFEIEEAANIAKRAVEFDTNGCNVAASYFYKVASKLLLHYVDENGGQMENSKSEALRHKANEYLERATILEKSAEKIEAKNQKPQSENDDELSQCYFLFEEGLNADEAQLQNVACEFYLKALDIGLKLKIDDLDVRKKLESVMALALTRAEDIKKSSTKNQEIASSAPKITQKKFANNLKKPFKKDAKGDLNEDEKKVLIKTSTINNNEYVPFMNIDLMERFQYAIPFSDPDGLLELSSKQKYDLGSWIRPKDICNSPCIFKNYPPNYLTIKQTIVSDCSFVASLAVCALYEARFQKQLISNILFPKNRNNIPLYNPFGKYMVKLHLNGIKRKIIIDDQLPYGRHGQLLCSYSNNNNEFWISLLEKAYMKVMGGYNFPGSNSNIDLHTLTGWIPDRSSIDNINDKKSFFQHLEANMNSGKALVTIATGNLTDYDVKRSGLVNTHAYAVLDCRTVFCGNQEYRLLRLKNPWSHLRWKGKFSELDLTHWTKDLQKMLNYDPNSALEFDNGIFWIDFDSVCKFFDVFYLNWNYEMFKFTYSLHKEWKAGVGPIKDIYNIGSNPQFFLKTNGTNTDFVWILLTRHITDIEDFKNNHEYITVLVYDINGKKVYYPDDPPPYIDGIRINSPHYLCKIGNTSLNSRTFTLVLSQYEKTQTIYYTLRVYSTCSFQFAEIPDKAVYKKEICSEWTITTAGGCLNNAATYKNNPKFIIDFMNAIGEDNSFVIELKGPKQYQIGFEINILSVTNPSLTAPFRSQTSGPYRSGFVVHELDQIPAGKMELIPSTFTPNQVGPFILTVKGSCKFEFYPN